MFERAAEFVETLVPGKMATIVALSGDLGAGKTTFSQGVARALGVEEQVTSPTFVLQKIYLLKDQSFDRLVHMDAYRLERPEQLNALGWNEITSDPKTLVLLEWPEHVSGGLPGNAHRVSLVFVDEHTRKIGIR
jgi:tRNA threonylcarbamoyladenosine biosynthesis protein TsaE